MPRTSVRSKLDNALRAKSKTRSSRTVTADDAQAILTRLRFRGNRSVIGTVLRTPGFRSVGITHSKLPRSKSRTIQVWRPVTRVA